VTHAWVSDALDLRLSTASSPVGLQLTDLCGLALRRNPLRAHLIVSTVLGKHIPADPNLVYGCARLLGCLVGDALRGVDSGVAARGRELLRAALAGGDARVLAELSVGVPDVLVLGYAETATALGHCVADALGADYLHSTRRQGTGIAPVGVFEEEHSHASSHLLLPDDPALLRRPATVVLVDDELSTGRTALNTITALNRLCARSRYVIAALVDLRSAADRDRCDQLATELGVRIDVVSLVAGEVALPADVLARGSALVDSLTASSLTSPAPASGQVSRVTITAPPGMRDGGRHGFTQTDKDVLDRYASLVASSLRGLAGPVLVLGFEELMYAPLLIARALSDLGLDVRFSSTTRSPVLALDDSGYAIRTALTFASSDNSAGTRFAYNVAGRSIVLVIDDVADTPSLTGLLDQLRAVCDEVRLVVLPSFRATPSYRALPLRGPEFGSYPAGDVGWLLTDLSAVELEAPIEEREEAIQSGAAHYAESLPIEYQPDAAYQQLYANALTQSAYRVAHAVGVVSEIVLAERGHDVVLASLARAGTPIAILIRRWAAWRHGLDLSHYAVSIVRGRGIDRAALRYLAAEHDPASVVFVDGWTGKGAIARELNDAIAAHNSADGVAFCPELAVLADTGHCVSTFGTREDFLIPSACLNSTVSGLVSRTVLNSLIAPGQFHGAKFYASLADVDVSARFIDTVSAQFAAVAEAVARDWPSVAAADRDATWAGWRAVDKISAEYGIDNMNLVKPGVGETTRVLLRRVPWKVLVRADALNDLPHIVSLAAQRGVAIEVVHDLAYSCVGLIRERA
jgi:adenine/guanine phosphoribosyltransferase-like PRPP-binding protein